MQCHNKQACLYCLLCCIDGLKSRAQVHLAPISFQPCLQALQRCDDLPGELSTVIDP